MDPASAIAGIIGLAALTGQTTSKLCKLIREVEHLPESLKQELAWLSQLERILLRFEGTCWELKHLGTRAKTDLLYQSLTKCKTSVQDLEQQVEARLGNIKGNFFQSRIKALRAVFNSEEFQRSKSNIDLCMKHLSLAHQEVSRYILHQCNEVALLKTILVGSRFSISRLQSPLHIT